MRPEVVRTGVQTMRHLPSIREPKRAQPTSCVARSNAAACSERTQTAVLNLEIWHAEHRSTFTGVANTMWHTADDSAHTVRRHDIAHSRGKDILGSRSNNGATETLVRYTTRRRPSRSRPGPRPTMSTRETATRWPIGMPCASAAAAPSAAAQA